MLKKKKKKKKDKSWMRASRLLVCARQRVDFRTKLIQRVYLASNKATFSQPPRCSTCHPNSSSAQHSKHPAATPRNRSQPMSTPMYNLNPMNEAGGMPSKLKTLKHSILLETGQHLPSHPLPLSYPHQPNTSSAVPPTLQSSQSAYPPQAMACPPPTQPTAVH